MSTSVTTIDDEEDLDTLITEHQRVIVDFHADWCGPCKTLNPILEEVATQTDIKVGQVDVESSQPLAQRFNIRALPAMVFFNDGEQIDRLTGVRQRDELEAIFAGYDE